MSNTTNFTIWAIMHHFSHYFDRFKRELNKNIFIFYCLVLKPNFVGVWKQCLSPHVANGLDNAGLKPKTKPQ